jgi:prepilin-type processing-associated H-X9-DG protein
MNMEFLSFLTLLSAIFNTRVGAALLLVFSGMALITTVAFFDGHVRLSMLASLAAFCFAAKRLLRG